jgi:diaminopimelate epimerase
MMIFYKTVSSGNDFIHVNMGDAGDVGDLGLADNIKKGELAQQLCQRQTSIGADGMVFYKDKNAGETTFWSADFEIYNRDGSEAELSGNGMAGLAALLFYLNKPNRKITHNLHNQVILNTKVGKKRINCLYHKDNRYQLKVEIGVPDFRSRRFFPFLEKEKNKPGYDYQGTTFYPVSLGNPHAVVVLEDTAPEKELVRLGMLLEKAEIFPSGANIELVVPTGTGRVNYERGEHFRIFFYERGVGPTKSSSTGSAAVFAVLRKLGLINQCLVITINSQCRGCPGETIKIFGKQAVYIENFTEIVYKGVYLSD